MLFKKEFRVDVFFCFGPLQNVASQLGIWDMGSALIEKLQLDDNQRNQENDFFWTMFESLLFQIENMYT